MTYAEELPDPTGGPCRIEVRFDSTCMVVDAYWHCLTHDVSGETRYETCDGAQEAAKVQHKIPAGGEAQPKYQGQVAQAGSLGRTPAEQRSAALGSPGGRTIGSSDRTSPVADCSAEVVPPHGSGSDPNRTGPPIAASGGHSGDCRTSAGDRSTDGGVHGAAYSLPDAGLAPRTAPSVEQGSARVSAKPGSPTSAGLGPSQPMRVDALADECGPGSSLSKSPGPGSEGVVSTPAPSLLSQEDQEDTAAWLRSMVRAAQANPGRKVEGTYPTLRVYRMPLYRRALAHLTGNPRWALFTRKELRALRARRRGVVTR